MKYLDKKPVFAPVGSLPVRGAWIEIITSECFFPPTASLPVRGAWIEISGSSACKICHKVSLPVRGAWIEI